eukprot:267077_1
MSNIEIACKELLLLIQIFSKDVTFTNETESMELFTIKGFIRTLLLEKTYAMNNYENISSLCHSYHGKKLRFDIDNHCKDVIFVNDFRAQFVRFTSGIVVVNKVVSAEMNDYFKNPFSWQFKLHNISCVHIGFVKVANYSGVACLNENDFECSLFDNENENTTYCLKYTNDGTCTTQFYVKNPYDLSADNIVFFMNTVPQNGDIVRFVVDFELGRVDVWWEEEYIYGFIDISKYSAIIPAATGYDIEIIGTIPINMLTEKEEIKSLYD